MNKVLVKESTLANIAEAIRKKNKSDLQMLPSEMPNYIEFIDTEKVTINGIKAEENLDLVSYSNTIEEVYTSRLLPTSLGTKYILNDGNLLYLKNNSSPFSVTLSYVHCSDLEHVSSTITIEGDKSGTYSSVLHQNSDNKIWLEIRRRYNKTTYYFSVYEITIDNTTNKLSFTNKCLNIQACYSGGNENDDGIEGTIVDSTGIYAVEREKADNSANFSITTYQFGTSNSSMKKIGNSFAYGNYDHWMNNKAFCKVGSTYYFFYRKNYSDGSGYDSYCSVTRNSSNSFSKSGGALSVIKLFSSLYEYNGYLYGIDASRNIYQYGSNTWKLKNTLEVSNGTISDMEYTLSGRPYRAINIITDTQQNLQYNLMTVNLPYSWYNNGGPTLDTKGNFVGYSIDGCSQQEEYLIYFLSRTYHTQGDAPIEYIKLYFYYDKVVLYKVL